MNILFVLTELSVGIWIDTKKERQWAIEKKTHKNVIFYYLTRSI